MEIISIKEVQALLIESHELNVPHYGLHTIARYEVKSLPFIYTVEFWSKHAPASIRADIVGVRIAGDAPMIVTDGHRNLLRDENGKVKVTRTVTVMCPKLSEKNDGKSIYYNGHSPEQVAQRYINRFLIPTTWGADDWVTKK